MLFVLIDTHEQLHSEDRRIEVNNQAWKTRVKAGDPYLQQ